MGLIHKFSLEFSPPRKQGQAMQELVTVASDLSEYQPDLMTVTYGAGGSHKGGTYETLEEFQRVTPCALACHLTHISDTKGELNAHLDRLEDMGIHHVVALRGDLSKDGSWSRNPKGDYFTYTNQWVEAAAKRGFTVSVGAYPEKHPDSETLEDDIRTLKIKCDAGAAHAFTQFFFDNKDFYRFRDATHKAGIITPIIPGLMRIHSFEGVQKFASKINARIPGFLYEAFSQSADPKGIAEELLFKQVADLKANGVEQFHFYTMNKAYGLDRSLRLAAS